MRDILKYSMITAIALIAFAAYTALLLGGITLFATYVGLPSFIGKGIAVLIWISISVGIIVYALCKEAK